MKIKCPNCGCEYEPSPFESKSCPICGNGIHNYIETTSTTKDK